MNFQDITNEYKFLTELHAHTKPVSNCGQFTSDEVVNTYLTTSTNTLTLTNHLSDYHLLHGNTPTEIAEYYLSDYYKAKKAAEGTGLYVALGVEIRFSGTHNDYLVYGVSPEDIEKMVPYISTDISTFYREFKNDKNIILHAHPFRDGMESTPIGYVDGIESFNTHPGHNARIAIACRFAKEHDLTVCGGSDYHEKGRHATCLMRTKAVLRDSFDVAAAIKSRDVVFDISGHIVIPYLY